MLTIEMPRDNVIEVSDFEIMEVRKKKYRIYQIFLTSTIFLGLITVVLLLLGIFSNLWFLLLFLIAGVTSYKLYTKVGEIASQLRATISTTILKFTAEKQLNTLFIRIWQQGKLESYIEKQVRINQAIGFKAIWHDDGLIAVDIIVDLNYPGKKIFETYNFYSLAELIRLFEEIFPQNHQWHYQLEDGSEWDKESKEELNQEIQIARVPWKVREHLNLDM